MGNLNLICKALTLFLIKNLQISPQCLNVGDFYLRGGDGMVTTQTAKKVFQNFDTISFFQTRDYHKKEKLYSSFNFFSPKFDKKGIIFFYAKNTLESLTSKLFLPMHLFCLLATVEL